MDAEMDGKDEAIFDDISGIDIDAANTTPSVCIQVQEVVLYLSVDEARAVARKLYRTANEIEEKQREERIRRYREQSKG